jgi:putative FmdB family regulatory protein
MPIYEFVCKECGQKFEEVKKYDDNSANCPVCSSEAERIMSATNFSVVGSTNQSVDSIIGRDAEQKWIDINNRKSIRDKQLGKTDSEINQKNQNRISGLLNRQQQAYGVIDKAKKDAGLTKKDEMTHLLKGSDNV